MPPADVATALDYADALRVARKAKSWLFSVILLMLLVEVGLFFLLRYKVELPPAHTAGAEATQDEKVADLLKYLFGVIDFLGVVLPLLLAADLLLVINIMLVGRLIGLGRLVSSFLWCVALVALLFPWQAFLNNTTFTAPEIKIPGVLYTWEELVARGRWDADKLSAPAVFLRWMRFVVFPVLAVVVLMTVQVKSSRGLKLATGEAVPDVEGPAGV